MPALGALLLGLLVPGVPLPGVPPFAGPAVAQGLPLPLPLPLPPPAPGAAPPAAPAGVPALVAELGAPRIEVTTAFAGTDVLVFGASERLLGPQGDNVVVVGQGPVQAQVVRRRVRVLGAWVNGASARFDDVPSWYALSGTAPLRALLGQPERRELGLGLSALARRAVGRADPEFRDALMERKEAAELWSEDEAVVEVSGGRLFHARLPLPAIAPTGDYIVQVLLVREGRVTARQELTFRVQRVGTAARITDVSRDQPLLYGLSCVVLAAFAGWVGSVLFRR